MHVFITFLFQTFLVSIVFIQMLTIESYYKFLVYKAPAKIVFCRYVCAIILHITLVDEVKAKLNMMKFVCNHEYKFNKPFLAWCTGLMMIISSIGIEFANILVLCCYGDALDLISNFVSLVIICEFDNFIFSSMQNESYQNLAKNPEFARKVFKICHTTSKKCHPSELSTSLDENGATRFLKICFSDRSLGNKMMYVSYKVVNTFYVSVYFYWLPFLACALSTSVPFFYRNLNNNPPEPKHPNVE